MELIPENIRRFWNGWQIRIVVLLSLSVQIILTLFGSRRKFTAGIRIRVVIWAAYLSAEWAATFVLGNLSTSDDFEHQSSPKPNGELRAFWSPFLLVHLGGPDTITAYSLEDNELWKRYLLSFVVQVGVSIYVYLKFWSNTVLTYLAIPIFVFGTIKCGERTLALKSSSKENFNKFSLLVPALSDMDEKELPLFAEACYLYENCARLFSGQQSMQHGEAMRNQRIFEGKSAKDVFGIIAIELGFTYDFLYTKAKIIYSKFGILTRCVSLFSSVSILVVFSSTIQVHAYPSVDILVTYLLLIGTIFTDLYVFIQYIFSDWTKHYLSFSSHVKCVPAFVSRPLLGSHKRWRRSMGQLNLISCCLKEVAGVGKLLAINETFKNLWCLTWEDVSDELQELIFRDLKEKTIDQQGFLEGSVVQALLNERGDDLLKEKYGINRDENFRAWFMDSAPFDLGILAWHIATDLCYYKDLEIHCDGKADRLHTRCKISKCLSDYMLYLLVFCPTLLPQIKENSSVAWRYKPTCVQISKSLATLEPQMKNGSQFRKKLIKDVSFEDIEQDIFDTLRSSSALSRGRYLGQRLQGMESKAGWDYQRKWEMISELWVQRLEYAASHGEWYEHGQHLRRGGELLTSVRLLMGNLGLGDQYAYPSLNI